jgi:hypothetical protein
MNQANVERSYTSWKSALAWEAETFILDLDSHIGPPPPEDALSVLDSEEFHHIPLAIAKHPEHGWMVLASGNAGPSIVWWSEEEP